MAVRVCCGDSVFKASPSAPASSAERSESPSLYAVRTSTLGADGRSRSAAITAVPLMLVSSRSSTTTSGLCCWTSFNTSVPSVVPGGDLDVGLAVEQRPQPFEHDRVVVRQEDADHGRFVTPPAG